MMRAEVVRPVTLALAALLATASAGRADVTFGPPIAISPGNLSPSAPLIGDLNSDGLLDAVYTTPDGPFQRKVRTALGAAGGSFVDVLAETTVGTFAMQALADFDGDGHLDLLARGLIGDKLLLRHGDGDGTFSNGPALTTTVDPELIWLDFAQPARLRTGALPDIVYCTRGYLPSGLPGQVRILRNNGSSFTFVESHDVPVSVRDMRIVNLDDDGFDDVVLSFNNGSLHVFRGNGTGGLTPTQSLIVGTAAQWMATGDLNADGRNDLLVVTNTMLRLFGNGDGTFGAPVSIAPADSIGMALGDVDGDGAPDLVTSYLLQGSLPFTSVLVVRRGFCDGSFGPPLGLTGSDELWSLPVVADLDADGINDLISVPDGEFVAVLYNQLAAPTYADLGSGLAGQPVGGSLTSTVDARGALIPGEPFSWTLVDALPGTTAYFILGTSAIHAPLLGGTLVPALTAVVGGLPVGNDGRLSISGIVPPIPGGGFDVFFQFWYADAAGPHGFAASPGVAASVP